MCINIKDYVINEVTKSIDKHFEINMNMNITFAKFFGGGVIAGWPLSAYIAFTFGDFGILKNFFIEYIIDVRPSKGGGYTIHTFSKLNENEKVYTIDEFKRTLNDMKESLNEVDGLVVEDFDFFGDVIVTHSISDRFVLNIHNLSIEITPYNKDVIVSFLHTFTDKMEHIYNEAEKIKHYCN